MGSATATATRLNRAGQGPPGTVDVSRQHVRRDHVPGAAGSTIAMPRAASCRTTVSRASWVKSGAQDSSRSSLPPPSPARRSPSRTRARSDGLLRRIQGPPAERCPQATAVGSLTRRRAGGSRAISLISATRRRGDERKENTPPAGSRPWISWSSVSSRTLRTRTQPTCAATPVAS
jgi:hypothetical protein